MQRIFRPVFNADDLQTDGSDFDRLFADGETFRIGELEVEVMHTPGHTPADSPTRSAMPCSSATRCSCRTTAPRAPISRAAMRASSIARSGGCCVCRRETRLFMCHDYKAPGRDDYAWETTVGEQRENNVHLHGGVTEAAFVAMRQARDATLSAPTLLLPSIQVNIRAGRFPKAESNGVHYLLLPVRARTGAEAAIIS